MDIWGGIGRGIRRFSSGIVRVVSNAREGSKLLSFLFRPQLVCIYYISEARGSTEPGMMASDE